MFSTNNVVRSRTAKMLLAGGVLATPLMLAGCSSASETPVTQSRGPLDTYMSQLRMSADALNDARINEHDRAEQLTAACMSKEGFDYKPQPFRGGLITEGFAELALGSGIDAEAEEFANSYGYGIVENPDLEASIQAANEQKQEFVDAIADYHTSLTDSEQEAYWLVLNGPPISEEELRTESGEEPPTIPKGRGCMGESLDRARNEQKSSTDAYEDPEFQDLFEAMNALSEPLNEEAPTDEDVIALNGRWNQCMTKRGHSVYNSPRNAHNTLGQDYDQTESDLSSLNQTLSKAEKDRFQALEIDVASADISCRKAVDYESELERITHEQEQLFVDKHKTRLEALVLRYGIDQE